jgi:pyruvate/2-oxoglutarate/acetoin dehydrogenase E1 component
LALGVADVRRSGDDVTVVAIGRQVDRALEAAERLAAEEGVSVEVVDPRTLSPLDADTIAGSIARTGRLVVAQEATSPYSFASEICALAAERCLGDLKAPPVRVTSPFVNVPTPVPLAEARAPGVEEIRQGVLTTMGAR